MRLYVWNRPDQRGGSSLLGTVDVTPGHLQLDACRDPELARALESLRQEAHLPLTIRQTVGGARHVRCERLTPTDADYWRALAEALTRRTGHLVTDTDTPPA